MNVKSKLNIELGLPKNLKLPAFLANPHVYIVLGMALIMMMTILLFTGSAGERESEKALEQGQRAVTQVMESVEGFRRLLADEQVHSLAGMAMQDSQTTDDLLRYLKGRIREVSEARLFAPDAYLEPVESLGESGYVILKMLMAAGEQGTAPIQSLELDGKPQIASVVKLVEEDALAGYLMVLAEPESITSSFNMTMPQAGYIGLVQANGRFNSSIIEEFGDPAMGNQSTQRLPVPGSLFSIRIPMASTPSAFGGVSRLLTFLLGGLLLAYGVIRHQLGLRPVLELKEDPVELESASRDTGHIEKGETTDPETQPRAPRAPGSDIKQPVAEVSLPDLHYDPDMRRRRSKQKPGAPVALSAEIFRAYDIRGIIDKTLDAGIARMIGQAVGSLAVDLQAGPVVVGRDGRHSGPDLVEGLTAGLASTGCDVVDIGAVPTGVLYYVAHESGSGSGVMVTGSHNPPDYNGFKVMMGGETLSGDKITALFQRLQDGDIRVGKGTVSKQDALDEYRERIASDIQLARPLKVVADCGNGIGGICAGDVLRAIGADVLPLYDEVDGSFPNHHPDPSEPENLTDLIESVRLMGADLGVAFDGDADRLGVVTPAGEVIFADRVMMLYVREILGRNPGARIIYDVKCTGHLETVIRDAGGEPEMYKTGHSLIKNRMKEVGAPFAGEMSGHFFFGDRWYGFDCGIYSAARLLEILAQDPRTPEQVLNSLPNSISTPELKVHMAEGENHAFITEFQEKARFADARVSTIDGVRADFEDGWGLCRASNTTPVLVVRFDAESEESLELIQEAFRMQMLALKPDLELPF
jgi:phosphomannomutase/phosphoglucomutase